MEKLTCPRPLKRTLEAARIDIMKTSGVILDRDGTINEQVGYVNHVDRFWLLPRAAAAIRLLNEASIPVAIATNQAGAARGYYPENMVEMVHDKMAAQLRADGARIDRIYVCPHLPGATIPHLDIQCECRKPKTAMLEWAAMDLGFDLTMSYVVGDRLNDIRCGQAVGARGILVLTGYGKGEQAFSSAGTTPDFIADDLYDAVLWILDDIRKGSLRRTL